MPFFRKKTVTYQPAIVEFKHPSTMASTVLKSILLKALTASEQVSHLLVAYDLVPFRYLRFARANLRFDFAMCRPMGWSVDRSSPDGYYDYLARQARGQPLSGDAPVELLPELTQVLVRNEYLYLAMVLKELHARAKADKKVWKDVAAVWFVIARHDCVRSGSVELLADPDERLLFEAFQTGGASPVSVLMPREVATHPDIYGLRHADLPPDVREILRQDEVDSQTSPNWYDVLPVPPELAPAKSNLT